VLVRTNAQGAVITEALSRAGIPHRLRGADQLLGRPGVVDVLRRLRREPYAAVLADLRSPPSDGGIEATALAAEDADQAAEDRATLVTLAREYEALDPEPSGPAFASWLVAAVRSGEGADKDVVEVSTLHAAKGLEWPVVHLAGLEDGLVPIGYAKTPAARAEEQRLLYVGVTRAQDEVRLHWSRTRVQGGEARERSPSPWLPPVEAAITDLLVASRPVDGRHHLEVPRAELHARHPDPLEEVDDVLARLAAWRAQTARVARVAPQAVVDDRTLHAIAEARPASVEALTGLPGLGPIKAARFGDGILAALDPS
jgi:DNA helicase-2/ATP-dependent DNA helicase PcrA